MKKFLKVAGVIGVAGAMALASASPSEARGGRTAAAIAGGFVAGAVVGSVAANANNGYYYGGPGYYDPGYGYDYGYAYEPAPAYYPAYRYNTYPTYRYNNGYDRGSQTNGPG